MKNRIFATIATVVLTICTVKAQISDMAFTRMDASDGLNDNRVQHIMQLPDGRMAVTTRGNINLYDGAQFRYIHGSEDCEQELKEYSGAYHVYVDGEDRLWVKNWFKVKCFCLKHDRYINDFDSLYTSLGIEDEEITDLFVDSGKHLWVVTPTHIVNTTAGFRIKRKAGDASLQDIERHEGESFLFYSNSEVRCYDKGGSFLYGRSAYSDERAQQVTISSLVIKSPDGNMYQLRNGASCACLQFNPRTKTWKEMLFANGYTLHTIIAPSDTSIYITTSRHIIHINTRTGNVEEIPSVNIAGGGIHTEGLNTIFMDSQKGIWLGTYDKGLLYGHQSRFRIKSYKHEQTRANILADGASPLTDSRGWTWRGSLDGLYVSIPQWDKELILYTDNGLSNNSIHSIIEDRKGDMWVATSYGINRIKVDTTGISSKSPSASIFSIKSFTAQDGTLTSAYSDNLATMHPDGTLQFEGYEGITLIHPDSTDTAPLLLSPTLTGISLNGERIIVGHPLLSVAEPYAKHFELQHDENNIRFDISALNYALPEHTQLLYRIMSDNDSKDTLWHTASVANGLVDPDGVMHLTLIKASPANYTLQVKSDERSESSLTITFRINPPWWQTAWARTLFALLVIGTIIAAFVIYTRVTRMRMRQRHKEEILLMRIHNMIERQREKEKEIEHQKESESPTEHKQEEPAGNSATSVADNEFIQHAIALVEQNINTRGYSVEQLSRDLCMERTGLYKKMTTLLDKSPSIFIRSIRLQHAETLLRESDLSIAEVAERTGFSSPSHMSKCFQEERGCTPKQIRESKV